MCLPLVAVITGCSACHFFIIFHYFAFFLRFIIFSFFFVTSDNINQIVSYYFIEIKKYRKNICFHSLTSFFDTFLLFIMSLLL